MYPTRDANGNLVDCLGNVINTTPGPLNFGQVLKVSVGGRTFDGYWDGSLAQIPKK